MNVKCVDLTLIFSPTGMKKIIGDIVNNLEGRKWNRPLICFIGSKMNLSISSSPMRVGIAAVFLALVLGATGADLYRTLPVSIELMSCHAERAVQSYAVLAKGGPLMAAPKGSAIDNGRKWTAIGAFHDRGIYVFLPLAMHWLHEPDPGRATRVIFLIASCFMVGVVFLCFWGLTRNPGLAAAGVLILHYKTRLLLWNGIDYWAAGWALAVGIPILLVASTQAWKRRLPLVIACLAVMSLATSFRVHAGLGVCLAGVFTLFTARDVSLQRRAFGVALAIAAYLAIQPTAMRAIEFQRDQTLQGQLENYDGLSHHVIWHSIYIGLGYIPNPYGLKWDDQVAYRHVGRNASESPLDEEYERAVRNIVFDLIKRDPWFVAKALIVKGQKVIKDTSTHYWGVAVWLFIAFLFRIPNWTKRMHIFVICVLPTAIAFLPPVLTHPGGCYYIGFWGGMAVIWSILATACMEKLWVSVRERHSTLMRISS